MKLDVRPIRRSNGTAQTGAPSRWLHLMGPQCISIFRQGGSPPVGRRMARRHLNRYRRNDNSAMVTEVFLTLRAKRCVWSFYSISPKPTIRERGISLLLVEQNA